MHGPTHRQTRDAKIITHRDSCSKDYWTHMHVIKETVGKRICPKSTTTRAGTREFDLILLQYLIIH